MAFLEKNHKPSKQPGIVATISLTLFLFTAATNAASPNGSTPIQLVDSGQLLGNRHSRDLALADIDQDGDVDAFVANSSFLSSGENIVWVNQAGDQFGIEGVFVDSGQLLGSGSSSSVALGDLNGDGFTDALVGNIFNGSDAIDRIWLHTGSGVVFQMDNQELGDHNTADVALGDIDLDGDLDAITVNQESTLTNPIWINQGGSQMGTEGEFISSTDLGSAQASSIALIDLDGDFDLDAFLGISFGTTTANKVWINQGGVQGGAAGTFLDSGQALGNRRTLGLAAADFDGDGDIDVLAANSGQHAEDILWINQGGNQMGTPGTFQAGQVWPHKLSSDAVAGDLDADGDLDVVIAHFNGVSGKDNTVWWNDGSGNFSDSGMMLGNGGSQKLALADLDGDIDLDLFVANDDGSSGAEANKVWLNTPTGPVNEADLSIVANPSGGHDIRIPDNSSTLSTGVALDIANNGPETAHNVGVQVFGDPTFLAGTGWDCQPTGPSDTCTRTMLNNGDTSSLSVSMIEIRQHNNGVYAGSLGISARIFASEHDAFPSDNQDSSAFDFYDCHTTCFLESLFCNSNFSGRDAAGKGAGFVPNLPVYFLLRQTMNHGSDGQRLVQHYVDHESEIEALANQDTALMTDVTNTLSLWEPALQALVLGDPNTETITQAQVDALEALLTHLETDGSNALQQTISDERSIVGPLDNLVGLTIKDVANQIIPSDVIVERGFERPETLTDST